MVQLTARCRLVSSAICLVLLLGVLLGAGSFEQVLSVNALALQVVHSVVAGQGGHPVLSAGQATGLSSSARRLRALELAWAGAPEDVSLVWQPDGRVAELDRATQLALGQTYFARGFEQEGQRMLNATGGWLWAYDQGRAYLVKEDWPQASVWLERAMRVDPTMSEEKAELFRNTCYVRSHQGDVQGALQACRLFMSVFHPVNGDYDYTLVAGVYLDAGRVEEARDVLLVGLTREQPTVWHYFLLGDAYGILGDNLSARHWFEQALALDARHPTTNLFLGLLLKRMGLWEEAVPHLQLALQSPETYYREMAEQALRTGP